MLTAAQVGAAEKIYHDLNNLETGQEIYPGEPRGEEAPPPVRGNFYGWQGWSPALAEGILSSLIGGLTFDTLNYTYADFFNFDFSKDTAMLDAKYGSGPNNFNSTNPDVRAFENHGGKALWYQGWGERRSSRMISRLTATLPSPGRSALIPRSQSIRAEETRPMPQTFCAWTMTA
jgi:Tannase and feruloyl esterase